MPHTRSRVVIANKPLMEYLPLYRGQTGGDDAILHERCGEDRLVKFDFLGLKTLTVVTTRFSLLRRSEGEIDLSQIPSMIPSVRLLAQGYLGIFSGKLRMRTC